MLELVSWCEFLNCLLGYSLKLFFPFSLTPFCWYSLPRGQKAGLMLTMSLSMNVWKVFVKCMKNIWREWIPTALPSHTISVSCLILLMIWQILAVLFTELIHRHTSRITKTGSKRRSTCSSVDRPNRLGSSWVGSVRGWGWTWNRCIQRAVVNLLYDSDPVSTLLHSSQDWMSDVNREWSFHSEATAAPLLLYFRFFT